MQCSQWPEWPACFVLAAQATEDTRLVVIMTSEAKLRSLPTRSSTPLEPSYTALILDMDATVADGPALRNLVLRMSQDQATTGNTAARLKRSASGSGETQSPAKERTHSRRTLARRHSLCPFSCAADRRRYRQRRFTGPRCRRRCSAIQTRGGNRGCARTCRPRSWRSPQGGRCVA